MRTVSYLLDTNVCIDFAKGRSLRLLERMEVHQHAIAVSAISYAELSVGAREATEQDREQLARTMALIQLLPFDGEAAEAYGELVRRIGVQRRSFDRLIGAHALSLDLTLVTNNEADFADIPGLKLENWTL